MRGRVTWTSTSGPSVVVSARKGPLRGWLLLPLTRRPDGTRRRIRAGGSIRLF